MEKPKIYYRRIEEAQMILEGYTRTQVAKELKISVETVRRDLYALVANSRTETQALGLKAINKLREKHNLSEFE